MTVITGIDPHKRSHTAVALDVQDQVLDQLRVDADRDQLRRLLAFAKRWPNRVWAVENANGLGRLLARQLVDHGEQVRDVPAKLSARVRALEGTGHKTDAHDARVRPARALPPIRATEAVRVSQPTPVEGWSELLLALPEFNLTAAHIDEHDELVADVELPRDVQACPGCGVIELHPVHDWRGHTVRHLPVAGRATRVRWRKRLLACVEGCGTFVERTPSIGSGTVWSRAAAVRF